MPDINPSRSPLRKVDDGEIERLGGQLTVVEQSHGFFGTNSDKWLLPAVLGVAIFITSGTIAVVLGAPTILTALSFIGLIATLAAAVAYTLCAPSPLRHYGGLSPESQEEPQSPSL